MLEFQRLDMTLVVSERGNRLPPKRSYGWSRMTDTRWLSSFWLGDLVSRMNVALDSKYHQNLLDSWGEADAFRKGLAKLIDSFRYRDSLEGTKSEGECVGS